MPPLAAQVADFRFQISNFTEWGRQLASPSPKRIFAGKTQMVPQGRCAMCVARLRPLGVASRTHLAADSGRFASVRPPAAPAPNRNSTRTSLAILAPFASAQDIPLALPRNSARRVTRMLRLQIIWNRSSSVLDASFSCHFVSGEVRLMSVEIGSRNDAAMARSCTGACPLALKRALPRGYIAAPCRRRLSCFARSAVSLAKIGHTRDASLRQCSCTMMA